MRILAVTIAGAAVFGVVDGSMWRSLLTPTLAYRPAILFGLTLVFGWRGFACSQLVFFTAFAAFLGWLGAVLITPLYLFLAPVHFLWYGGSGRSAVAFGTKIHAGICHWRLSGPRAARVVQRRCTEPYWYHRPFRCSCFSR